MRRMTPARSGFRARRRDARSLPSVCTQQTASAFAAAAEQLGFIVRADDPRRQRRRLRRRADLCLGAYCGARPGAARLPTKSRRDVDDAFTIHISGCAKGCAHAAPAALTVVGTPDGCALVADGSARDAPFALVTSDELPEAIARFARERKREVAHG